MNSFTVINFINFRLNQVSEQGLTYPPTQPKQTFVNKHGNVFRSYTAIVARVQKGVRRRNPNFFRTACGSTEDV